MYPYIHTCIVMHGYLSKLTIVGSLSGPMLGYCYIDPGNKLQWNLIIKMCIFIHEHASGNVRELVAILYRPQFVKLENVYLVCYDIAYQEVTCSLLGTPCCQLHKSHLIQPAFLTCYWDIMKAAGCSAMYGLRALCTDYVLRTHLEIRGYTLLV